MVTHKETRGLYQSLLIFIIPTTPKHHILQRHPPKSPSNITNSSISRLEMRAICNVTPRYALLTSQLTHLTYARTIIFATLTPSVPT